MRKMAFLFMICITVSYADLREFARSMVLHEDKAGTFKTEDRTILYGGGYSYRAPNVTLTPFNVKAPSVKAGCNGIDLAFGSISFLDKDQFVKFAEGILAAAPGVAFDLALKTLCPSCSETLKALESMANEINNMSLDSCAAATALINGAYEKAGGEQLKQKLHDGDSKSWLSGATDHIKTGTQWISGFNSMLSGLGNSKQSPVLLQLIKEGQDGPTADKDTLINLMATKYNLKLVGNDIIRTIFGDIALGGKASNESPIMIVSYPSLSQEHPRYEGNTLIDNSSRIIDYILTNSANGVMIYHKVAAGIYGSEILTKENSGISLETHFKTDILRLMNKMRNREPLSDDDIKFIGQFQTPIYKIFNALSTSPQTIGLLYQNADSLAKMLAVQVLYEYTQRWIAALAQETQVIDRYKKEIEKVPTSKGIEDMKKSMSEMMKSSREFNEAIFKKYAEAQKNFFDNLKYTETMKQTQEMKNLVMLRVNPDILKNLEFTKNLYK